MSTQLNTQPYFSIEIDRTFERERLDMMQRSSNPTSIRRLQALGIAPGWKCLEVGGGQGDMARWIAEQVGPSGRVVATDIDTRRLGEISLPNLEVRQHNILKDPIEEGGYDLVHCRAVLMHLSDPMLAMRRMSSAVRPGGWLLLEDADQSFLQAADPAHPSAEYFNRQSRQLYERTLRAKVYDPYLGRRVRFMVEDEGFTDVMSDGVTNVVRGGHPYTKFQTMTDAILAKAGMLSESEMARRAEILADPTFGVVAMGFFGAWGKRPS